MNSKISLFSALTILVFTLISCEGGTTFSKSIENNTQDTINVEVYFSYMGTNILSIYPNETKEIFWDDRMGQFVDDTYSCIAEIDSAKITTSSNKTLMKDIMNSDNWLRNSVDGRNSKEDCLFRIDNIDLK